jgi:hypothetical protein
MIKTPKQQTLTMETKLFQKSKYILSYSIKALCSTMIQWSPSLPLPPRYILHKKNNPMFYSNSNGDNKYVI